VIGTYGPMGSKARGVLMTIREKIPDEEVQERLRGCYSCFLRGEHVIHKDNSLSLQPRVTTRVVCGALNNQVVRPTKGHDPNKCSRRIHVENKHSSNKHLSLIGLNRKT
jgi:hypothetical protein